MSLPGLTLQLDNRRVLSINHLALDFTGTLALDGQLLPGVDHRLTMLAQFLRVTVMTADTFGTAQQALHQLPVALELVKTGPDKARLVRALGPNHVAVIGNGRNDLPMFKAAALSIAVIGPEGAAASLLHAADILCLNIHDALDLFTHPLRLKATLRN
jgi:P-type E1-E2 ATPase